MGSADPLEKRMKNYKAKTCKKEQFSGYFESASRCRELRYADKIFIQIYIRMHHFVVRISKFSSPQAARGHLLP